MTRRQFLAAGASAAALLGRPRPARATSAVLDDASRLNATRVARHSLVRDDTDAQLIAGLRQMLKAAAAEGRAVSLGCARHSMGGQSLYRDSVAATFDMTWCEPDLARRTYVARGGTRWSAVIARIDPLGFSPAVMQSNYDFGVAGTLSVNAHGWPVPFGPFGTTVRSVRLLLADGTLVRCSAEENPELLALVIGGYGLFGIILDAEMTMVENQLLRATHEVVSAGDVGPRFVELLARDGAVRMAYGRLAVYRRRFLRDAVLVSYRARPTPATGLPRLELGGINATIAREIFRAQTGSESMKVTRWYAETKVAPKVMSGVATRNTLLNEPVSALGVSHASHTDILHEYFLPPERLGEFLATCQDVIGRSGLELLNVTLRYVATDTSSVLAYAPRPRIAAVMLFSQRKSADADRAMQAMTEVLIESAITLGGSFYLPYRLHARRAQVVAAYPRISTFIAGKLHYDPHLRFRNAMWDAYFGT